MDSGEFGFCGADCGSCEHMGSDCSGCHASKGMVFWSEYIGGPCPVNVCCTGKGFPHCGKCPDVPCALILDNQDPNNSCEENEEILNRCLESLAFLG